MMVPAKAQDRNLRDRASGVLLHLTSLPGRHGSGDLGKEARGFAGFLARGGFSWWQMLPVNPPGHGESPYDSASSVAGSLDLISLDELAREGLLLRRELKPLKGFRNDRVEFGVVRKYRRERVGLAHERFGAAKGALREDFDGFCGEQAGWLDDFAMFCELSLKHGGKSWWQWDEGLRGREPAALREARVLLADRLDYHRFVQFIFDRQWMRLKSHAEKCRIGLIGDVPIFVGHNSADVWANPQLFQLDAQGHCKALSGYPPDAFCPDGQCWGHPQYRWPAHAEEKYGWWVQRFAHAFRLFDAVRIDHFLGFARLWSIPAGSKGKEGHWVKTPGREILEAMRRRLGEKAIIAEDLGHPTPGVDELLDEFGIAGMRILQSGFYDGEENRRHLPHNAIPRSVAYTGTHDNDTIAGWFAGLERKVRRRVLEYTAGDAKRMHSIFVRMALQSSATTAIVPMQDLLGLSSAHRMNVPGTTENNWRWRVRRSALSAGLARELRELNRLCDRGSDGKAP